MSNICYSSESSSNLIRNNGSRDNVTEIGRNTTIFENPRSVMIISKHKEPGLILFTREVARNLLETPRCMENKQTDKMTVYVNSEYKSTPAFGYPELLKRYPSYSSRLLFWTPEFCKDHPEKIDFIITLGGDGTVLYATWLFQNCQVPPILPFHFGSLGFLTVFKIDDITETLNRIVGCDKTGICLNVRMRLLCTVQRFDKDQKSFEVINDIVVDRGPSAYMSQLELMVQDQHLTTVQADGLVVSTPTGSTAYSLAAGGSLVHPEVPAILLTPICAHSLSFRPMLLPDNLELKIHVPVDSRNTAWVSFDGRHRMELRQGDYVIVKRSRFPVPTVSYNDKSVDWFECLKKSLHWNQRARQKPFPVDTLSLQTPSISENPLDLQKLAFDLFQEEID